MSGMRRGPRAQRFRLGEGKEQSEDLQESQARSTAQTAVAQTGVRNAKAAHGNLPSFDLCVTLHRGGLHALPLSWLEVTSGPNPITVEWDPTDQIFCNSHRWDQVWGPPLTEHRCDHADADAWLHTLMTGSFQASTQ